MKKKIYFLVSCLFIIYTASAQTNVSGFISANTTWNLLGSPYIVVGNTILSAGYTLTIDPGVTVKFDSAKALQIDGTLHAVGNAASRITFTSNRPVPAAGDWAKIQFTNLNPGAVFDMSGNYLSGSIMKYCDVLYAGQAGGGAIFLNTSLYISCCNINYCATNGISCSGFVKTDSTSVRHCAGIGISLSGMPSPYCPYTIAFDTLEYNTGGGIRGGVYFPGCTNHSVIVSNCYFSFNSGLGALSDLVSTGNLLIRENEFLNNSSSSSDGAAINTVSGSSSVIECNLFLNNQSPISTISIGGDENDTIRKNRFEGNVSSPFAGSLIQIFVSCCSKKVISDNYFFNNSASSGGKLLYLHGWDSSQFFVTGNEFNNGLSESEIYLSAMGTSTLTQYASISHNNFLTTNVQYVIENAGSFNGQSMNADSNYWNSSNTQHIDSMIYDFFDNANYSVVYYAPILTTPVVLDTVCGSGFPTGLPIVIETEAYSSIFPNPFATATTIAFGKEVHSATFSMYNFLGEKVKSISDITGESLQIDRGNLQSGVYVYEVMEEGVRIDRGKAVIY